jgi:PleD family two-component response regulator
MTSRRSFYKNKSVLVVDDSDQIRSYFKSMLLLIGFDDVTLARDAEMALASLPAYSF